MGAVKVTSEARAFLQELVAADRATSLSDAVTYLCKRVRELDVLEELALVGEALGGKRERVSLGTDDRARFAAVSEPVLGKLWNSMTEMKQAMPETVEMSVMHASLGSSQFPCEWGSLLLQIEEAPGRGRLSRLDAASFLVNGWLASENIWQSKCAHELSVLNDVFGKWAESGRDTNNLAETFQQYCPTLEDLI